MQILFFFALNIVKKNYKMLIKYSTILYAKSNFLLLNIKNVINVFYLYKKKINSQLIRCD